jgi:hypothetical protein
MADSMVDWKVESRAASMALSWVGRKVGRMVAWLAGESGVWMAAMKAVYLAEWMADRKAALTAARMVAWLAYQSAASMVASKAE